MRFLLDGMLGRLARWLRLMGHEAKYLADIPDEKMIERAISENSILLTRDLALYRLAVARGADVFLVKGSTLPDRLANVARRFNIRLDVDSSASRCPACGAPVKAVSKEDVKEKVPPTTFKVYDEFWICVNVDCGKVYWRGSHWTKISGVLLKAKQLSNPVDA